METIPDIIRGFRAADGEVLRIAGAEAEQIGRAHV